MNDYMALLDRIKKLENKVSSLEKDNASLKSIAQLKNDASINDVIMSVNKITHSLKRKQ
jgi:hypothetical protein